MSRNQPNQTLSISYNCNEHIEMHDAIYVIEQTESKAFTKQCRVCNGDRYLTMNGVKFRCPCCEQEEVVLYVKHYVVCRYQVCKIEVTREVSAKTDSVKFYCSIEDRKTHYQHSQRVELDRLNRDTSILGGNYYDAHGDSYTDYNLAVKCAMAANEREQQKLIEYNEEHGTSYKMPIFETQNDKR